MRAATLEPPVAPDRFALPAPDAMRDLLPRLLVPPQAVDEIVASTPSPTARPKAWALLERLYAYLVASDDDGAPPWPAPWPMAGDPLSHHFHLYVFLAAIDHVRELYRLRGIDDEILWATLSDLGLQVAHYEVRHGRPGFDGAFWMWGHFRGEVYRIGRLQFHPVRLAFDIPGVARAGDACLDVHIPAAGPLTAEACDNAFARARTFFDTHFPEHRAKVATCTSWLLDRQFSDYLGDDSNIVSFGRRFTVTGETRSGDEDVLIFAFGRRIADLATLPQTTALARAITAHLAGGGHFAFHTGWLAL